MKKILVTGSDGFIGSHLVEALVLDGFSVRAFVMYNSFNSWGWLDSLDPKIKSQIEIYPGDIRDPYLVKNAMIGCQMVCHLAALVAIPFSYRSPDSFVDTNIKGTLNVLQAAKELKVERFVHTSSSEVYGTPIILPINEHHPLQGQSPYSATKIAADQLVYSFYSSFDVPAVILRPFNTYGPRQSMRAVIPSIITQLVSGRKKIKLGLVSPTRDFNFVKDTVAGFISVLNSDKGLGEVFNLGTNYEVSIGQTASIIAEIMDIQIEIETEEERLRPKNSEVERLWADNTKAKKTFNWSPNYVELDGFKKGLKETIEWFLLPHNLALYKPDIYNI